MQPEKKLNKVFIEFQDKKRMKKNQRMFYLYSWYL